MRALICNQWDHPRSLTVGELPRLKLLPGHVRAAVHACGINFADALIVQGLYQERPAFPFAPGLEAAGEVLEVGEGVTSLAPGMRVAVLASHGGMAEEVVVPATAAISIPDGLDYVTAAGFCVAYGTAHMALDHRACLQPGETLLVHGASGGVGLAAVEIGRLMGATVIATASTEQKLALARAAGAHHTINYADQEFRERVLALTDRRGADVIFDPVGGDVFDQSVRCIAWEGRLLVIGFAGGRIPKFPINLALVKNFSVVGLYWGAYLQRAPQALRESLTQLFAWHAEGKLSPHISKVYSLDQAADALTHLLERKATGKVVVAVRG